MSETLDTEATELTPREDIRADLQAAMEPRPDAVVETAAPEVDAPEGETAEERDTRLRDERGRFARAEATEATTAPTEPATPPVEAPKGIDPPATWPADAKAMFAKLPPEMQEFTAKRYAEQEADYTRKTTQVAALRRDFEPVAQMFEPHRQVMQQKGFTPASLIKGYIETEGGLMDPQRAPSVAARIIKGYNIPPEAIMRELGWTPPAAQPQQPGPDGEMPPPVVQQPALPPEVTNMLNELAQRQNALDQQFHQQTNYAQQQAAARVMSEIERFKAEVGADGRPLRPYFADVEQEMADLGGMMVQRGGDMPPLQELYDTAVYANPITRARVLADQSAAVEAQRMAREAKARDEAKARAAKARLAGSSVTGAPGAGHAVAMNGTASLRDDLRAAMEVHS